MLKMIKRSLIHSLSKDIARFTRGEFAVQKKKLGVRMGKEIRLSRDTRFHCVLLGIFNQMNY